MPRETQELLNESRADLDPTVGLRRMLFGKVLAAIANKHTRQLWTMLAHDEAYDANAWLKHPMVQRLSGKPVRMMAAMT